MLTALALLTGALLLGGCAQHYYNVPKETYEKQVRILGVAPLFVDTASDIRHPDKDALVATLKEANRKNEKYLVEKLRETGTYFAVRQLDTDPDRLLATLLDRREKRDDAGVLYTKYFYRQDEVNKFLKEQGVDAVMLVTVSGQNKHEKLYGNNYLSYLEADHNILVMTAHVLSPESATLWEYPNFRQKIPTLPTFFKLQYPAFEEADANATDVVELKYRTLAGINRLLIKKEGYPSTPYQDIFDDMAALQKAPMTWDSLFATKKSSGAEEKMGASQEKVK